MPVTLELLDEGRIVLVTFMDPWTAEEMKSIMPIDYKHREWMAEEHPGTPVHLIADFTDGSTLASGALGARQSPSITHETRGMAVVVTQNLVVQMTGETVFKLAGQRDVRFVQTLDEAFQVVRALHIERKAS